MLNSTDVGATTIQPDAYMCQQCRDEDYTLKYVPQSQAIHHLRTGWKIVDIELARRDWAILMLRNKV